MTKSKGGIHNLENGSQLQDIIFGVDAPTSQKQKKPESIFQRDTRIVFQTFCDKTSLHGLQYVGAKDTFWFRLFWAAIFAVAFTLGCFFISKIYEKWQETPVMVTFTSQPVEVDNVLFPAVTVCPNEALLAHVAQEFLNEGNDGERKERQKIVQAYCDGKNIYNDMGLKKRLKITCHDLMLGARYPSRTGSPMRVHKYVQEVSTFLHTATRSAILSCCTFNAWRADFMYRNLNLSVLPHVEDDDEDFGDESRKINIDENGLVQAYGVGISNGFVYETANKLHCRPEEIQFWMSIHNPQEAPDLQADNIIVKPGAQISYNVKPLIIHASSSLNSLKHDYRKCYFSEERYLRFYKHYTKRNCELDCLANMTLTSKCACVPDYIPAIQGLKMCTPRDRPCLRGLYNDFERGLKKKCDCLQPCEDLMYLINTQYVPGKRTEEPKIMFDVSFTESIFFTYFRSELFTLSDFLASCGGLLGLFMGFSFISMIEVFYFLTVGVWKGIAALRKQK